MWSDHCVKGARWCWTPYYVFNNITLSMSLYAFIMKKVYMLYILLLITYFKYANYMRRLICRISHNMENPWHGQVINMWIIVLGVFHNMGKLLHEEPHTSLRLQFYPQIVGKLWKTPKTLKCFGNTFLIGSEVSNSFLMHAHVSNSCFWPILRTWDFLTFPWSMSSC